jgi:hypothetical protein
LSGLTMANEPRGQPLRATSAPFAC